MDSIRHLKIQDTWYWFPNAYPQRMKDRRYSRKVFVIEDAFRERPEPKWFSVQTRGFLKGWHQDLGKFPFDPFHAASYEDFMVVYPFAEQFLEKFAERAVHPRKAKVRVWEADYDLLCVAAALLRDAPEEFLKVLEAAADASEFKMLAELVRRT